MSECSSPISRDCASESTRSSGSPSSFDEPEVYAALRAAAEVLESLGGATVVEVQVPYYEELCSAARITSRSESFAYHADDLAARWDDYFRSTRRGGVSGGAFYTAAEYVQAQRVRRVVQRALAELYTTVDLVITPNRHGVGVPDGQPRFAAGGERFVALKTNYWNGSGNPALSVPMGALGDRYAVRNADHRPPFRGWDRAPRRRGISASNHLARTRSRPATRRCRIGGMTCRKHEFPRAPRRRSRSWLRSPGWI